MNYYSRKAILLFILSIFILVPAVGHTQIESLHVVKEYESGHGIYDMAIGPDDVIWLGTDEGLVGFDGEKWITYTVDDGLITNNIYQLDVAPNGDIWLATHRPTLETHIDGTGITMYNGQEWTTFTIDDGLTGNICADLTIDKDGTVWVSTYDDYYNSNSGEYVDFNAGICRYNGTSWEVMINIQDYERFCSLACGEDGEVWATGLSSLLYKYDGISWTRLIHGIEDLRHPSVYLDSKSLLWIRDDHHIIRYNNGIFEQITGSNGGDIESVYVDSKGVLWVGSKNNISMYDGHSWIRQNIPSEYSTRRCCHFESDSHDVLWFAAYGALLRIGERPTHVENVQDLPGPISIRSVYPNPFNPVTHIEYIIPTNDFVTLAVYNTAGQLVETLVETFRQAGNHTAHWNAAGQSSGIYFCTLRAGGNVATEKMVLVK